MRGRYLAPAKRRDEATFCIGRKLPFASCARDRVLKFRPPNEADQRFILSIVHDREALEFLLVKEKLCVLHREIRRWKEDGFVRHRVRDWHVENVILLVVEKGEAVEPDHAVCNATFAKSVTDGFRYSNDNLISVSKLLRF